MARCIRELFQPSSDIPAQIRPLAPSDRTFTEYDRQHLLLYAALLDAADAGEDWKTSAATILEIDVSEPAAEACWRSHLQRARWIVGDGLASALMGLGTLPDQEI